MQTRAQKLRDTIIAAKNLHEVQRDIEELQTPYDPGTIIHEALRVQWDSTERTLQSLYKDIDRLRSQL